MKVMTAQEVITEKILGICRKPHSEIPKCDENNERLYHVPLHLPPFWWNQSPKSNKPWQYWKLEDYTFRNCKWEGCYWPCSCRVPEVKSIVKCRFPGHCGFHKQLQKNKKNCMKPEMVKSNNMENFCCYCKLKMSEDNSNAGEHELPDPRCLGQFHRSLLENILGRGTTLVIGKNVSNVKEDCPLRGYIPGDVYGYKSWSRCIGGDPMHGEMKNAIYPLEFSLSEVNLEKESIHQETIDKPPPYEYYHQDHRFQYGISPEQLRCEKFE